MHVLVCSKSTGLMSNYSFSAKTHENIEVRDILHVLCESYLTV
mgnify:CR=1 FL=1